MSNRTNVASVLLVATAERQRVVAPWLKVVGEPVGYTLERVPPADVQSFGGPHDLILIDGESVPDDADRESLLRRSKQYRFASLLYLCNPLPSDREIEQALAWADDVIQQDWQVGDRVRRRVQTIALAPWRRTVALRMEATRKGDRRLRVVRSNPTAMPANDTSKRDPGHAARLDPALSFVLLERAHAIGGRTPELVAEVFHEGRRVGVGALTLSIERLCDELLRELEQSYGALTPELMEDIEALFRVASGSPVVAARFGGAGDAIATLREELRRLTREELAAIERHETRRAQDP